MTEEEGQKYFTWRWIAFVVLLALLISGLFYMGAFYSCKAGGNKLTGLKCMALNVIDVCEQDGNYYIEPNMNTEKGAVYVPPPR